MNFDHKDFFVSDGYSEEATIAAAKGIHGELRFRYRPMLHNQREKWAEDLQRTHQGETSNVMAKAIGEHLLTWSLPIDVKPDLLRTLRPQLLDKIYSTIAGYRPSDSADDNAGSFDEAADLKN
ncbi:hypothetical protein Pan97_34840 [Bremerella volcania]|uniref:Uncharacterized protein n=1 Tax=Bremerella volcania TaxID=2527984 RepID=A0A518CB22_9BACT|nr:hypothetical protein [Bremerella volcania]QDU76435.1 hypothetical protein Pan97_34840 [Bremerella volcania]